MAVAVEKLATQELHVVEVMALSMWWTRQQRLCRPKCHLHHHLNISKCFHNRPYKQALSRTS
jgi:hypothetical protein